MRTAFIIAGVVAGITVTLWSIGEAVILTRDAFHPVVLQLFTPIKL